MLRKKRTLGSRNSPNRTNTKRVENKETMTIADTAIQQEGIPKTKTSICVCVMPYVKPVSVCVCFCNKTKSITFHENGTSKTGSFSFLTHWPEAFSKIQVYCMKTGSIHMVLQVQTHTQYSLMRKHTILKIVHVLRACAIMLNTFTHSLRIFVHSQSNPSRKNQFPKLRPWQCAVLLLLPAAHSLLP